MLKTAGPIYPQSIYSPTSSYPNIASLNTNLLGEITPFESDDFLISSKNIKLIKLNPLRYLPNHQVPKLKMPNGNKR